MSGSGGKRGKLRLLDLRTAAEIHEQDMRDDPEYRAAWLAERVDPRDFTLTAADLRLAADRLYQQGDQRLDAEKLSHEEAVRYGQIRNRLRSLADAIEDEL